MMNLAGGLAALGASATGVFNFFFRFPDLPDLLTSRWFLSYVAISFLLGMAAAYYYDCDDPKLIDILCAALRIVGALMVFYSLAQLWELAMVAEVALAAAVAFVFPGSRWPLHRQHSHYALESGAWLSIACDSHVDKSPL